MDYVFLRIYLASELHRLRLENACQLPCFVLREQTDDDVGNHLMGHADGSVRDSLFQGN